ncbi:uncharacterized protein LOC132727774 [Ruditapes philippinarum]|uniref:uncharacterized protein LOC132727774 n=1 Tax=Ruditapes philippinarum TaxID=129788 RepID=UPI00295BC263|nr:uncharacterized protein LOC132727774 [Ruditapes philippinarum]
MGFNTTSVWIKVAFICLLLALVLFVIGFATISWMTSYNYALGLWKTKSCYNTIRHYDGRCRTSSITSAWLKLAGWEDWFRATQAFECIGLICLGMALLIMFLFVFVDSMKKRSPLLAVIFFCFGAVLAMVIGFLILGLKLDHLDIGWSMGLAIAGCILTFVAGVMSVIDLKK